MKIRTQFIITMILFCVMLLVVFASTIITQHELERLDEQRELAHSVERGVSDLSYLSSAYLLYQEGQQRARWNSEYSSLSTKVSRLKPEGPEQQALVDNIKANLQRVKAVFADVISGFERVPHNRSAGMLPASVQVSWSRMAVQNQGIFFDASRLSQMFQDQRDQLTHKRNNLIFSLLGLFVVVLLSYYLLVYRRALRSISELQAGTRIIGAGNLEYALDPRHNDEIGELSHAFNRMTASLREVTASKAAFENEVAERKQAEQTLAWLASFPQLNPSPVVEVDLATVTPRYVNPAARRLFPDLEADGLRHPWLEGMQAVADELRATGAPVAQREVVVAGLYYQQNMSPVPGNGRLRVYGIDVTGQKRAQEELARQRESLRITLTSIGDAVITTDTAGRITFLNPVAESLTGWKERDALGQPIAGVFRIINEQTRQAAENIVERVLREEHVVSLANHTALITRDGSEIPIEDSAAPITDAAGGVSGVVLVFHDVTEKRRAQAAIRQAKEEWERTFDCVPDLIAVLDDQHRVLRVNRTMAQRLGRDPKQCIGVFCCQCVHGTDTPPAFCPHSRSMEDGRTHAVEVHEDRLGGDFLVTTTPLLDAQGAMFGTVHVARDITDRVRAEKALRESEERYRGLMELAPDAILVHQDRQIVYANAAAVRLYGAESFEQLRGKDLLELVHLDEREAVRARVQLVRDGGIAPLDAFRHLRLDGQEVLVEATAAAADWQGKRAVQAIIRDIAERKRAEQALRESREDLNRAQAVAHTGSWRLDARRNELRWSDETHRMFGIPQGTPLTYEMFLGAVHPEDRQYVEEKWTAALGGAAYDIEHRIVFGDTTRWVREKAELEFDNSGGLLGGFGTVQDITERKRAEEALRKAHDSLEEQVRERTAELSEANGMLEQQAGQLRALAAELILAEQRERRRLAEVLHDGLQQLLVASRIRAHMLGRTSDPGVRQGCQEMVALLEEALAKARALTGELSPPALQRGGLLPALEWLTRWMGEKHHLTVHLRPPAAPLPTLAADVSVLLYQAVRELLLNTVKYAQVTAAEVTLTRGDDALTLRVSDAGVGFDPIRLRVAGGTEGGFGLFGIRERLELMGGWLKIDSAPGQGSRFTLVAPLRPVEEKEPANRPREATVVVPGGVPAGRRTRVLVVDDHALVRRGFATLLAGEPDLEVVGEAADGKLAIELAQQLQPDVILMDVSMPVLNGVEATRAIHSELPGTRVIGLSALDDTEESAAIREAGAVAYLSKSDSVEALLAAIRRGDASPR
jgi:PAS domain S-box-containing protein